MDYLERLRTLCNAYPGVYEDFPWGHESPVFKTPKGKIFAMSGVEDGTLRVTVKLTPDEGAEAMMLPFVTKAAYVGRFGWVASRLRTKANGRSRSRGFAGATSSWWLQRSGRLHPLDAITRPALTSRDQFDTQKR